MGIFEKRMFQPKAEPKIEQGKQDQEYRRLNLEEKEEKIDHAEQCLNKYQEWLDPDYVDSLDNARSINITQKQIDAGYLDRLKSKGADEEQIRRAEEAIAIERAKEFKSRQGKPEILLQHFTRIQQGLNKKEVNAKQGLQDFPNSEIEKYTRLKRETEELKAMVISREIELQHLKHSLSLTPNPQKVHRIKDFEGGISNMRTKIMIKEEKLEKLPYSLQLQEYESLKKMKKEFENVSL